MGRRDAPAGSPGLGMNGRRSGHIAGPAMSKRAHRRQALRMLHRTGARQRCTECRCWFRPAPCARQTQHVCGEAACRRSRRAKLARRRRRRNEPGYRVDERERQDKRRAVVREAKAATAATAPTVEPGQSSRHSPPSVRDHREVSREMLEAWDVAIAASRATLERSLTAILGRNARSGGTDGTSTAAASRATPDADGAGNTA